MVTATGFEKNDSRRENAGRAAHQLSAFHAKYFAHELPGGHLKFPHLWPGQIPPGATAGA